MAGSGNHRVAGGTPSDGTRHSHGTAGLVVAAVLVLVAVAVPVRWWLGSSNGVRGTAVAESFITPDNALPIRRVSAAVDGPEFTGQEDLVRAIIADLTQFWSAELPSITGKPFAPLRGTLTAMDSSGTSGSSPCVQAPGDIMGNAFYCPSDDGIVYDATTLVPVVLHRYGVAGLVTTFAHEFGHAVEARIADAAPGGGTATVPSLTVEARADCDAGAFVAWVRAGHATHTHLAADAMLRAIGPLVDFSDPATLGRNDPTAHGLSVDRLSWFVEGYGSGAAACARLGDPLRTALGAIPDAGPMDVARYGTRALLLTAAERSVDAFAKVRGNGSPSPESLDAAAPHGQFAVATVVALAVGATRGDSPVTAACFAGTWVRSTFGHAPRGTLGSWPGDADEGLAAVLLAPDASFESARAYIGGFDSGSCG